VAVSAAVEFCCGLGQIFGHVATAAALENEARAAAKNANTPHTYSMMFSIDIKKRIAPEHSQNLVVNARKKASFMLIFEWGKNIFISE